MAKRYQIINVLRKIKPDGTDAPVKIQLLANIKPAPVMEEGRDERGEIGTDVDRSVLSEDGLYNLMEDLDDLMHTFEELQDKFAADSDLELKLQD